MRAAVTALLIAIILARAPARAQAAACGDADGNGVVTVSDGVNALRAAAALSSTCSLSACDVNRDERITVTDGVDILRRAAGLSAAECDACCVHCGTSLPCGNSCIPFTFICREPVGCACF